MQKLGVWAGFALLVLSTAARAQDAPKAEIFGGYSHSRAGGGDSGSSFNVNGWNAAVTGNFNSWFGVTADFCGHYGSPGGTDVSRLSFLLGPTLRSRGHDKVSPFLHALFGGVRGHRGITPAGSPPPLPQLAPASEAVFGMALGGGVDYNVNERVAIRLVQADYLLTTFSADSGIYCITTPCPTTQSDTQHNLRLSFGIVARFGGR